MLSGVHSALVAGATGFIGSALIRRLSEEGVPVFCLVRPESLGRSRIQAYPGIHVVETADYEIETLSRALSGIHADVIFNLASAGVDPDQRVGQQVLSGNVNVVAGLISAVSRWSLKKFIHVGSCSEYGPARDGCKLSEEDPLEPASLYGAAKACAYIYGTALAAQYGLPFLTLRLFGVFGLGEASHRLVPYLISRLRQDRPVDLTAGEQVRDFLYVDNVIEALLEAAQSEDLVGLRAYNVCSARGTKIRQIAENVAEAMKKPKGLLRFGERPYRADEPMWLVGDNRRFAAMTGWSPRITVWEGIRRMVSAAV